VAVYSAPPPPRMDVRPTAPGMPPARKRVEFNPEVFVGEFATTYALPGRQRLLSGARSVQLSLGRETVEADVYSRFRGQVDRDAFLVAELVRPAGSWPRGKLQLYRDGTLVGDAQLQFSGDAKVQWLFGRDERLRVLSLPERLDGSKAGLISKRRERQVERVYELQNRQDKPVAVVVLEASPVSQHADIRVDTQFDPAPAAGEWHEIPGIRAWRQTLPPKQTQRFTARYKLSAPADAQVTGWR
ncbi:MAG TPA: DUF4139 domain-containing protein, partial [Burkholderiaceae bacterium]|nr:DUF4139 domain-containing protein [Burkholderiaceae bacterium]